MHKSTEQFFCRVQGFMLASLLLAGNVLASNDGGAPPAPLSASNGADSADDGIRRGLLNLPDAPLTVSAVRARLQSYGGQLASHIVANRGHENPESGSFSIFESYEGPVPGGTLGPADLYLGYFTQRLGEHLAVQPNFAPGLVLEAIAWDKTKRCYNFWELLGTGKTATWHYRGDSNEILADTQRINSGLSVPTFGRRLRCSGCHTHGGPIMKELDPPHNDWWAAGNKLALGSLKLAPGRDSNDNRQLAALLFTGATDAEHLAGVVRLGIDRLVEAHARQLGNSTRQQLRSLFTTMEINLASDLRPFRERMTKNQPVELPAGFFVDPRLSADTGTVPIPAATYRAGLAAIGSKFAADEVADLSESRHAFVVPVRSYIDQQIIESMLRSGLVDEELVADILAVDFTTPVFSTRRAQLMKYVPEGVTTAAALRAGLLLALRAAPVHDQAAAELLRNLSDPTRTAAAHRERARAVLAAARRRAESPTAVIDWLTLASQRRVELSAAEISKNPLGQISEPGFRVLFPKDKTRPVPGRLRLDPTAVTVSQP